jgi:uncharacterized membrane protein
MSVLDTNKPVRKGGWAGPVLCAAALAVGAYYATLAATPYALMHLALGRLSQQSPWNHFSHSPPVDARDQSIVRPSPDLLYSTCPYDLSGGPIEVRAWPVPGHYSSISVFDARTDVAYVRNDEQMAGAPMHLILALADQAVPTQSGPDAADVVRVSGKKGVILQRVLLNGRAELPLVDGVRSRATCQALPR